MSDLLDLYDYRIRVAAMYRVRNRAIPAGENAEVVCKNFRAARDELFASHPQSALDEEQRARFEGLRYFPYNPAMRVAAEVDAHVEPVVLTVPKNAEESMTMTRVARLHFTLAGQQAELAMYWLNIYGGGLFLPFRDTTSPAQSYGGGRYLFDTIKGSDFLRPAGASGLERIVLDFNYAYNPSCAYNSRWVCPLAPVENRLNIAIPAGEQNFSH
jgi:uncharacterized protein